MKIKYRSGYAEGGFLDDGAAVDPVSGNEVPAGSLVEEVRDDIPAQLSEGEFVVPADVVRFIGLDKLMKMRDAAKAGLADMEADGQMGGSPAPMAPEMTELDDSMEMDALIDGIDGDDFEGATQRFADGALVTPLPTYKTYTGNEFGQSYTVEDTIYVNAEGDQITVKTLRGEPLESIPAGYTAYVAPEEGDPITGPVAPPIDSVAASTVNSGPSYEAERTNEYRNNTGQDGYQADIRRSEKIRSDKVRQVESLASVDMNDQQMDIMYASLTPLAKEIFDTRFRDTTGIDSWMTEGMSQTDLLITAQKTANTQNRAAGRVEPESGFLPDGEPIDWVTAMKYAAAGLFGGPLAATSLAIKNMSDADKAKLKDYTSALGGILSGWGDDSEYKDNIGKVSESKPVIKTDQKFWQNFTGTDSEAQSIIDGLASSGRNKYGHKVFKEPGTRTIWDDIAEVQANQQNTIDLQDLRAADALDNQNLAEVRSNRPAAVRKAKADLAAKRLREDKALQAAMDNEEKLFKQEDMLAARKVSDAKIKEERSQRNASAQANAQANAAAEQALQNRLAARKVSDAKIESERSQRAASAQVTVPQPVYQSGQNDSWEAPNGDVMGTQQMPERGGGPVTRGRAGKPAPKSKKTSSTSPSISGNNPFGYAHGGLTTKANKPKIKKMPKDNATGLASKMVEKQKTKAKKGALAAKRT